MDGAVVVGAGGEGGDGGGVVLPEPPPPPQAEIASAHIANHRILFNVIASSPASQAAGCNRHQKVNYSRLGVGTGLAHAPFGSGHTGKPLASRGCEAYPLLAALTLTNKNGQPLSMRLDDELIEGFYAAAMDPGQLPGLLDDISRRCEVAGATLVCGNTTSQTLFCSSDMRPMAEAYFRFRADVPDPRESRVLVQLRDGFLTDFDHFTREEIARDPFYQEFLRPIGLGWHAAACLTGGDQPILLSLKREHGRGPFTSEEIAILERLLPAMRSAMRLARRAGEDLLRLQLKTIEQFDCGAILLDNELRVIEHNARLPLEHGLTIRGGRLRAHSHDATRALHDRLAAALRARDDGSLEPIVIRHPRKRAPLIVDCCPLNAVSHGLCGRAALLVLVREPDRRHRPDAQRLRDCYGLTQREAELASEIAVSRSLEDAAERVGMTTEHARTRLKSIFAKLGVSRQSELLLMLTRT